MGECEAGFDIPAELGWPEARVQTPCLVLDLDAFDSNLRRMRAFCERHGVRLRPHAKMHKSVDVARLQIELGGASGICCQKVSEAEVFARAGIDDILITNQIRDPLKIDRMARLPLLGAKIACCIDDVTNVAELSAAGRRHGTEIGCLVELDCGAGRCGVGSPFEAVAIAEAIAAAPGLRFLGLQAYNGAAQHVSGVDARKAAFASTVAKAADCVAALAAAGLRCEIVTGGGTGSYRFDAESGLYTELQCGSYAFLDNAYGKLEIADDGKRLDEIEFEHALFLLTSVMSRARPGVAICDAGLKSQSVDSGLPAVFGRSDINYVACNDEHGILADPGNRLDMNERIRLVPGHCDPTCNLHDWFVGIRNGVVEALWPVSARGKSY